MNAMSVGTVGAAVAAVAGKVAPPAVEINGAWRVGSAAVLCSFNGVQHRAVVDVGDGNWVRPGDVAAMLEALAARVRAG